MNIPSPKPMDPELSVVIPIFNELGNLLQLVARLRTVLDPLVRSYELLFIDDGSTDGSRDILAKLQGEDHRISAILFTRNFGHQVALAAGIDHARGAAVICIDGDLQHPPELIPEMLREWKRGVAIVHMAKIAPLERRWFRGAAIRASYAFLGSVSGGVIHPHASDFYLLDRRVVDLLRTLPERTRFHRGLIHWLGFPSTVIPFRPDDRYAGQTKYSLRRYIRFFLDGATSFSTMPIRMVTALGFIVAVLGLGYAVVIITQWLIGSIPISGWATIVVLILIMGGVQLVSIGMIGEYVGRIFSEVKRRPLYVIRECIGRENETASEV